METWEFNGVSLNTKWWNVENTQDGSGTIDLRGEDNQIPYKHGSRYKKKTFDSRSIMLNMWVAGPTMQDLDDNINTLSRLFGRRGRFPLCKIMRNGEVREALAEVYTGVSFPKRRPGFAKFVVEFELADPFFYTESQTQKFSGATFTITNPGTAETDKVTIKLNGPLQKPRLTNTNNGIWFEYQGDIPDGESVLLGVEDFSCYKGDKNHIAFIKHGGDMKWLYLETGENNMTFNNTSGSVDITFAPAYF